MKKAKWPEQAFISKLLGNKENLKIGCCFRFVLSLKPKSGWGLKNAWLCFPKQTGKSSEV